MRAGCDGVATSRVGAWVWALNAPHLPNNCVRIKFNLWVCDGCRGTTVIEEVVDDPGWIRICKSVRKQGKATPDRRSLKIMFDPLLLART